MKGSARSRLLDVLQADGGWLTIAGLSLMLPEVSDETLRTYLYRLGGSGLVEKRTVSLASTTKSTVLGRGWRHDAVESRTEWRAV